MSHEPQLLLTRIGVPAPFTVDTIIEMKQPKKMTAPNTIACCGYLHTTLSCDVLLAELHAPSVFTITEKASTRARALSH